VAQEQSPFNRVNDFIRRLKTEGKEAVKPPDFLLVSGALAQGITPIAPRRSDSARLEIGST
jgi:hypothetical protein